MIDGIGMLVRDEEELRLPFRVAAHEFSSARRSDQRDRSSYKVGQCRELAAADHNRAFLAPAWQQLDRDT